MPKNKLSSKVDSLRNEFYEGMRNLRESQEQTEREIKRLGREIGRLTDGWGKFVEALVAPAVPKLFKALEIKETFYNIGNRVNGKAMEVDVLGIGKDAVVVCSVKSRLQTSDVNELMEKLPDFFYVFPLYKGKKLLAAVGGIRLDEGVISYAQKQGLYVIGSSGDAVKLLNKKGFKPKVWG